MINLCNDVLNKERRNLFPKIQTLNNKLSLYSLIFLKRQEPFKFYKSFYDKLLLKKNKNFYKSTNKSIKNNSFLSLLSKSQNYFYSVPIKYRYEPKKYEIKYNENNKYNEFNNIMPIKNDNSLINKTNSNPNVLLNNKNLKVIHEYLVKNNNININKNIRNKSCKDIYMKNDEDDEIESDNSIINDKISRGQQTISNARNFFENEKNNEIVKNNNFKNNIKYPNEKQIKYKIKKEEIKKKFTINFEKKSKINSKKKSNSINKINIIWKNLRRPIIMKFGSSFKLH